MQPIPDDVKVDLQVRLKRIEGQLRGVQRMLDESRDCQEVLQQIAAVRAAFHHASLVFARGYALECLLEAGGELNNERLVEQLVTVLSKV